MKKISYMVFLGLMILLNGAFAQEPDQGKDPKSGSSEPVQEAITEETYVYTYPVIAPEVYIFGGYRFVDVKGSNRVEEFEYLHDSVVLGGELRVLRLPHRFHLELDIKNEKDYFGDLSYAYKDLVLLRGMNTTLFHNLNNITLRGVTVPSAGVDVTDSGMIYGVKTGMSSVFLRLKMPDFPLHVYVDGDLIERDGMQQLRSLLGSGYFNNIVRASQSRDEDWHTKDITVGANSHLGPIEIDYSHSEKRFDVGGNNVFLDPYSAAVSGVTVRNAGVFPHNLVPELKGSSDTLKLHTSYTGGLVASATLSRLDRKNRDSGAKADYFIGAGEVTWMPIPKLTFFVKYRHKETDVDNPGSVTIMDRLDPSNSYTFQVRPSISSIRDDISGIARYRPFSGLTLRAEYTYDSIRRSNADLWELPGSTQRNIASLSADVRLLKGLHFKAKYTHREIDDPAYNNEPNRSDEGKFSLSWIPLPKINTMIAYNITDEKRDDLHFMETSGARDRDVKKEMLLGTVTVLLLKDLSVTMSYAYMHNKIRQDIEFQDLAGVPHVDPRVPYADMAHSYGMDISYLNKDNFSLSGGVNYTVSSAAFSPSDPNLLQPVSVASFSELKLKETAFYLSGEYRFKGGFALDVRYKYSDLNDVLNNPFGDVKDGRSHIVTVALSKRW